MKPEAKRLLGGFLGVAAGVFVALLCAFSLFFVFSQGAFSWWGKILLHAASGIAGGYAAARIAGHHEILLGLAPGFFISYLMTPPTSCVGAAVMPDGPASVYVDVPGGLFAVYTVGGLLGGYLCHRALKSRAVAGEVKA